MGQTLVITAALVVVVLLVLALSIRVVAPHQRVVLFRLGKADGSTVRGPGLVFLLPVIDRGVTVDLREQATAVSTRAVTKDNAAVSLDLELSWRITDPLKSVLSVVNLPGAIAAVTGTTVRDIVGELRLDELLSQRNRVIGRVRDALEAITARWGAELTRLDMDEIAAPSGGPPAGGTPR